MALPLPLRNRLAELILDALHDPDARKALEAVARVCATRGPSRVRAQCPPPFPRTSSSAAAAGGRSGAASGSIMPSFSSGRSGRDGSSTYGPSTRLIPSLATALVSAALLFHAHLYFEVHELLEPYWLRAEGGDREALQGLIQVAVGFAHLANGNVAGARALLHDGCARAGAESRGCALDPFGRALQRSLDRVLALGEDAPRAFDWNEVPRFP